MGGAPCGTTILTAIIFMYMAQWCFPLRRQQAGRAASALAEESATSGPSAKKSMKRKEKPRRIFPPCYTTSQVPGTVHGLEAGNRINGSARHLLGTLFCCHQHSAMLPPAQWAEKGKRVPGHRALLEFTSYKHSS